MATNANGSNSFSVGGTSVPVFVPALVTAVLTVVFMFLPWIHVPIAQTANMASAFTGQGVNIAPDYTILGLNDLMAMVPADPSAEEGLASVRGYIFFWGASIAVLVVGAAVFVSGRKWLLIVGSVLTALAAIVWCGVMAYVQSMLAEQVPGMQIFSLPPWPIATIVASTATIVLAVVLKPTAAGAGRPVAQAGNRPVTDTYQVSGTGTTRSIGQQGAPAPSNQPVSGGAQYPPQGGGGAAPSGGVGGSASGTPVAIPVQASLIDTSCYCPNCGALVQVSVPASNCLINITCGGCGHKFPMEVRPRG